MPILKVFLLTNIIRNTVVKEDSTDEKVTTNSNIVDTTGAIKTLSSNTKLYTNSSMSVGYNYKKGTKVQVLENVTSKIDKVKIVKTGLVRYMYNSDSNTNILKVLERLNLMLY